MISLFFYILSLFSPLFSMNIFCFKISFVSFRFYEFATNVHFESVPESKIDFFFLNYLQMTEIETYVFYHVTCKYVKLIIHAKLAQFSFCVFHNQDNKKMTIVPHSCFFLLLISRIGDLPLYYTDTRTSGDFICGKPKSNGMQTCSAIPP